MLVTSYDVIYYISDGGTIIRVEKPDFYVKKYSIKLNSYLKNNKQINLKKINLGVWPMRKRYSKK